MEVIKFEPPGPGLWRLDRSHYPGGTTPVMQELISEAMEGVFRREWANFGIPLETMSVEFVNGFFYSRMRPLISPDRPASKPPPFIALWLVSRLHPEFRRREKAAKNSLEDQKSYEVIRAWNEEGKPSLIQKNLNFQDIDLVNLDDSSLGVHLSNLIKHLRDTFDEHFRLHCYDLPPIGHLLAEGPYWGIPSHELVTLLVGASPSTSEPIRALKEIATEIRCSGITPSSLEELAAISESISEKLDNYLRFHGSVLYSGYDVDSPTLNESPEVLLATILASDRHKIVTTQELDSEISKVRTKIPTEDHERFEILLSEARKAMDLRDDNGPLTIEWPSGLLRLAMLEAGSRLSQSGRITEESHIFELTTYELVEIISTGNGPSANELSERAVVRSHQKTLDPPTTLGKPEMPPSLDALPRHLGIAVNLVQTVVSEMGMDEGVTDRDKDLVQGLFGVGIGTDVLVQRARVAENAHEAFEKLRSGEILVTRTTSPAFNVTLALAGGLVTEEGGPMCHAAVLSRELGLPAVIGVVGALEVIEDGALIEVDPGRGYVRVLE
tara:strand:- start:295 stop:1959 length:1665 start_codon:yes stop_codon:yes gene_type:complete